MRYNDEVDTGTEEAGEDETTCHYVYSSEGDLAEQYVTDHAATGPVMCAAISASEGAISGAAVGAAQGAAISAVTGAVKHRLTTGSWKGAGKAAVSSARQGAIDGAFSGAITGAIAGALRPSHCFVAGTVVLTSTGYVVIEEIERGDLVWSWDEDSGDIALKEVTQTFENQTDELIRLTVNDEIIVTTPGHPFYVAQKGWNAAESLRAGDILVTVNGEYVVLEQVQHEILESPVKVYNFEVQDYHVYFVSEEKLLVHNACGDTGTYNELRKQEKGSGNEVHHIIEKRFVDYTNAKNAGRMQSVVLTKEQHRIYTNAWRKAIPYGSKLTYNRDMIRRAAIEIYRDNPVLLRLAMNSIR